MTRAGESPLTALVIRPDSFLDNDFVPDPVPDPEATFELDDAALTLVTVAVALSPLISAGFTPQSSASGPPTATTLPDVAPNTV
jgi:hypothetical protein